MNNTEKNIFYTYFCSNKNKFPEMPVSVRTGRRTIVAEAHLGIFFDAITDADRTRIPIARLQDMVIRRIDNMTRHERRRVRQNLT